jgi:hypothetical protein
MIAPEADQQTRSDRSTAEPARRFGRSSEPNTITASQARAAQRREARRDELAVSNWLREIAARPR